MALNSLDFSSVAHLHVKQCGFLTTKRSQKSCTSDQKSSDGSVDRLTSSCSEREGCTPGRQNHRPPVEWERTVEAAKKEGKVVVSVPASAELRRGIEKFQAALRYRGRAQCRQSGLHRWKNPAGVKVRRPYFDLHMGGSESMVTGLLSEGLLEPLEPAMILPEVKDPNNWWGGHIWVDNAKRYIYSSQAYQIEIMWYNTDQVKPEEIRSFNDLLNPKWSGKIGYLDPRTPGAGTSIWSFLWKLKGEDYLKKLVGQKLFLSRDQRVLAESLAKGKLALVVGLTYYSFVPYLKAGLPVKSLPNPRDEIYVSGGSGHVTIIKGAPHPNATKVFINWFLGKEGQEIFASDGSGDSPPRCRYSMVERVRRHRG